jgi:hypothetical protein
VLSPRRAGSVRVLHASAWPIRLRAALPSSHELLVIGFVSAVIVFRALVYLLFEQLAFDSDQAIIGLMAKHLSQGRSFPLFFYGQTFMLGVEAWAAVPFFLVAGPTVFALRLSILAWNIAFGVLLVKGLQRAGLPLSSALTASMFFVAAPASVSTQLMVAQGGIIEPFVYIAVLWFVRRSPLWFGAVLAIGFRNREFTLYAVPVLLLLELATGELNHGRIRDWLIASVTFFAVWEAVEGLKRSADLLGPGTRGQLLGGVAGSQVENMINRFNWGGRSIVERIARLAPLMLAWFTGAAQVDTVLPLPDRPWLLRAGATGIVLASGRLLMLLRPFEKDRDGDRIWFQNLCAHISRAQFPLYIMGAGTVALLVFIAGRPAIAGYSRYAILGLLLPVGLTAAVLQLEGRVFARQLVTGLVIAWTALMLVDHARVLRTFVQRPPSNGARKLADGLVERHVPVAIAGYWQAYLVTFLTQEQVRVASRGFVRIQEYQDLFLHQMRDAIVISETACPDAEKIASWYLCKP